MKPRKRLTREKSREVTLPRLIEAAETLFIRKGFDDPSVEEISEMAGYSRVAFYSNFDNKEQVFLALIDRRRPKDLDDFQQVSEPAERVAAVRAWFSNQWRFKDFIALRMDFSRRAMRDRTVRKRLAELRRQEFESYAASVGSCLDATGGAPADRLEIVALVLLAVAQGPGALAIDTDPEWEHMYAEAAGLAFDRLSGPQKSQL